MRRRLNNFFKSIAALMFVGVVVLGGSRTVSAANYTYTWTVYNNGPGAVQETHIAYLPYQTQYNKP